MNVKALLCLKVGIALLAISSIVAGSEQTRYGASKSGEMLFQQHCAVCHPDGGNVMNPKKNLHKKDRIANKINTEGDLVKLMRNPGPGMTKFDTKVISDNDAKVIAEYIIKTFNK